MATKHLRKPVLTDDVRAGTDVETWKSAFQRNLSYILGHSPATATMNDWYSAGTTTRTIKTHVWCLRQKIERDPKNAEILITEGGGYWLLTDARAQPERMQRRVGAWDAFHSRCHG